MAGFGAEGYFDANADVDFVREYESLNVDPNEKLCNKGIKVDVVPGIE